MSKPLKDRTIVAGLAVIALTAVTVTAIFAGREIAAIAPFVSAIVVILGYVGGKELQEHNKKR